MREAAVPPGRDVRWASNSGELPLRAAGPLRTAVLATLNSTLAGFVYGATGVGGGVMMVVGLKKLVGLTQLQAIGTSQCGQSVSTITGAGAWLAEGNCDLAVAACLAGPGLVGVIVGIAVATRLPERALMLVFASFLCFGLAPLSVYKALAAEAEEPVTDEPKITRHSVELTPSGIAERFREDASRLAEHPSTALLHCAVGVFVGLLTGGLGVGDTPVLIAYLTSLGYSQKEAIGTSLVGCCLTTVLAAALHLYKGTVPWLLIPITGIVMGGAAAYGAMFAGQELTDRQLQFGFAALLVCLGGVTAHGALPANMFQNILKRSMAL